jgi:hypothetical protein
VAHHYIFSSFIQVTLLSHSSRLPFKKKKKEKTPIFLTHNAFYWFTPQAAKLNRYAAN